MEWVETTGKTVEEAKEAALDELGVDEEEAEFEVLEQPRPGLFGRIRSEARVRARVMPSSPRPKLDRRDRTRRRRRDSPTSGDGQAQDVGPSEARAEDGTGESGAAGSGEGGGGMGAGGGRRRQRSRGQGGGHQRRWEERVAHDDGFDEDGEGEDRDEVEVGTEFLTGLLEAFGGLFSMQERALDEDFVELSVQGEDLGLLIGPRGQTLAAVQELTRTVVQRRSRGRAGRIVLDIAGYRQARRAALERFAREVAGQVVSSGVPRVLEAMPPADRKVVHDTVNTIEGVATSSEGEEPRRRVVISPVAAGS